MKAVCKICKQQVTEITNFHIITPYHVVQNITVTEPDVTFCDNCWDKILRISWKQNDKED